LALSKNGWLWIDGDYADYVAHVDLNAVPPTISTPVELSKLTHTECLPMTWFFSCRGTQGYYSRSLERIFVSTTKRTAFS
jgi:hypothetical protein